MFLKIKVGMDDDFKIHFVHNKINHVKTIKLYFRDKGRDETRQLANKKTNFNVYYTCDFYFNRSSSILGSF
jgi:hypothetical protein